MAEYDEQTGSYKFKDESRYLDQLLTDYLGREDPTNAKIVQEGAIATAQRHNEQKARLLVWASGLLATIVIGLIIMAIISVASL